VFQAHSIELKPVSAQIKPDSHVVMYLSQVSGREFGLIDEGVDVVEGPVNGAAQVGGVFPVLGNDLGRSGSENAGVGVTDLIPMVLRPKVPS
jgi:hypothetical protein